MYKMINTIQRYSWGSHSAISDLLAVEPPGEPEAELWMGAHPKAPSQIETETGPRSLLDAIQEKPETFLGSRIVDTGGTTLPFLLKVLAAEQALSIQAHPDLSQARAGFDREERDGIAIDAPDRNYRDPNHKPEVMCALTEFWALIGFRSVDEIRANFAGVSDSLALRAIEVLGDGSEQGVSSFLLTLLNSSVDEQWRCIEAVANALSTGDESRWVARLRELYQNDIGVLAPLFLNLVCLAPGESAYLGAGVLHAYLSGVGIELMANSDNVLRGGLTQKHIDPAELKRIVVFKPFSPDITRAAAKGDGVGVYVNEAVDFELSRLEPARSATGKIGVLRDAPSIAIVTEGSAIIKSSARTIDLQRGHSAYLLPLEEIEVSGSATLYLATIPQGS